MTSEFDSKVKFTTSAPFCALEFSSKTYCMEYGLKSHLEMKELLEKVMKSNCDLEMTSDIASLRNIDI